MYAFQALCTIVRQPVKNYDFWSVETMTTEIVIVSAFCNICVAETGETIIGDLVPLSSRLANQKAR